MAIVLISSILFPIGIIDFDKLQSKDLIIAEAEGSANFTRTLKLKENNKFSEISVCFDNLEIRGNYKIINDTVFFSNIKNQRNKDQYYKFALIKPRKTKYLAKYDLILYGHNDSIEIYFR